ncbi:unnamed protein product, partial [Didymodactylos carnosus]
MAGTVNSITFTSYCLRQQQTDNRSLFTNEATVENIYKFVELHEMNITSGQMLFNWWSASVDIVEQYEIYLQTNNTRMNDYVYCKCRKPWFGPHCEFKFDTDDNDTTTSNFTKFAQNQFLKKSLVKTESRINHGEIFKYTNGTSYIGLECIRYGIGLDWREICDGKIDRVNGEDEENCFQLEINECDESFEFRCRNGLCIPLSFYYDLNVDCLDQSDEILDGPVFNYCRRDPSILCHELMCPPNEFSCGDDQCTSHGELCGFPRDLLNIHRSFTIKGFSTDCGSLIACFYLILPRCSLTWHTLYQMLDYSCPDEPFLFPPYPVLYNHIYFVYTSELMFTYTPYYICYDPQWCKQYPPTINFKDFACRYAFADMDLQESYSNWEQLIIAVKQIFRACTLPHLKILNAQTN